MEIVHWNKDFETGIDDVDEQHHHLVDIVNDLNALLSKEKINDQEIENVYSEMVNYVEYHFKDEENLMIEKKIHSSHLESHIQIHKSFVDELLFLKYNIYKDNHNHVKYLLDFLTHWLIFHILGIDQSMAREIETIVAGESPKYAHEKEKSLQDSQTKSLLIALNSLFELVSAKNKELVKLNRTLHEKVILRTEELAKTNEQLEILALTDPLTQLSNRRHGMILLETLWEEAVKLDFPLVCMIIDVDNFKGVNDKYGHQAGDIVLVEIAQTLKQSCRTDDVVCRLGGDEFLVICPKTDLEGGKHIAENLHKAVCQIAIPMEQDSWQGSISLGIASKTKGVISSADLVRLADKAAYAAKEAGKNCVKVFVD